MSKSETYVLTPKGQLVAAVAKVFPGSTMDQATQVWESFNDSVYRHAGKSSDPKIADAEYLAIVLDGHGGSLIPIERDDDL